MKYLPVVMVRCDTPFDNLIWSGKTSSRVSLIPFSKSLASSSEASHFLSLVIRLTILDNPKIAIEKGISNRAFSCLVRPLLLPLSALGFLVLSGSVFSGSVFSGSGSVFFGSVFSGSGSGVVFSTSVLSPTPAVRVVFSGTV